MVSSILIIGGHSRLNPSPANLRVATRKLAGEGFKREWPPIIKMDETIKRKVDELLGS